MSKGIRRPYLKHPFEAKNVIVAGCAAIAMVLGAMSVGASYSSPDDRQTTSAEVSSIVNAKAKSSSPSAVSGTNLSQQHTLEVRDFLQQQDSPLYTSPAPSKSSRNSLLPVFGTNDPLRLIDQIAQPQQPAQPIEDTRATSTTPTSPTPADDPAGTGSTPTDETTPSDESDSPTGNNNDVPDQGDNPSPAVTIMHSSPTPTQ